MLSLIPTGEVAEPGTAEGPPIEAAASARDAVSELLWSGREAAPVLREGASLGRVRLAALLARAAGPR